MGDLTGDGLLDGDDVQLFVNCFLTGNDCACADVDGVAGITVEDISEFVQMLVGGSGCGG